MISYKEKFVEYMNILSENDIMPDNSSKDIILLFDNRRKLTEYFDKCLTNRTFKTTNTVDIYRFIIDVYATLKTIGYNIQSIIRVNDLSDDMLNLMLSNFGFDSYQLMTTETKRLLLLELVKFYKMKGTPNVLAKMIEYSLMVEVDVIELWLTRNRNNDDIYFRGRPVFLNETGKTIGSLVKTFDETIDGRWLMTKEEILQLDNQLQGKGLPSMSPYFSLAVGLDMTENKKASAYLLSESQRLYNKYILSESDLEPYRTLTLNIHNEPLSILEVYLAFNYLFNEKFNRTDLPANESNNILFYTNNINDLSYNNFINLWNIINDEILTDNNTSDPPMSQIVYTDGYMDLNADYNRYLLNKMDVIDEDGTIPDFNISEYKDFSICYSNRYIYFSGGIKISTSELNKKIYRYDIINKIWQYYIDMPENLSCHGSCVIYDTIVFVGGFNQDENLNYIRYEYNTKMEIWYKLENQPALIYPVVISDEQYQRNFYILNGINEFGEYNTKLYLCQISEDDFIEKLNFIGSNRLFPTCTIANEILYLCGGIDHTGEIKNDTYSYNIQDNTWLQIGDLPVARFNHNLYQLNNELYCIGGFIESPRANLGLKQFYIDSISANMDSGHFIDLTQVKMLKSFIGISCEPIHQNLKLNIENNWDNVIVYNNDENIIYDTSLAFGVCMDIAVNVCPYYMKYNSENKLDGVEFGDQIICEKSFIIDSINDWKFDDEDIVYFFDVPGNVSKREQYRSRINTYIELFTQQSSEIFIKDHNDVKNVLNQINPVFYNKLQLLLLADSDEFNLNLFNILTVIDSFCYNRKIYSNFRSLFLINDDTILTTVIKNFKPVHSRYVGFGLVMDIKDRLLDKIMIDEWFKYIFKTQTEDRLIQHEFQFFENRLFINEYFTYLYKFDQINNRGPFELDDDPTGYSFDQLAIHDNLIIQVNNYY